uniref:Uncharacterized protein n=1 Tax=Ignisphaera aggregans TaxID=334771 RepID=A0A7J2TC18_9CREN
MSATPYSFEREWALKWLKGSVESYFRGKTSLQIVVGRIRRALKSYSVSLDDVKQIVNSLLLDPLINIPKQVREERAKELLKTVEDLEKGERSG